MKNVYLRGLVFSLFLALVGCGSTPTWEGMAESEISQWRAIGFDAGQAQKWSNKGFNPEQAGGWKTVGFDLETATKWGGKSYSSADAKRWVDAGFNLDDANDARAKGLTPVRAAEPELEAAVEEPAAAVEAAPMATEAVEPADATSIDDAVSTGEAK